MSFLGTALENSRMLWQECILELGDLNFGTTLAYD
jgi:hypothetical protein